MGFFDMFKKNTEQNDSVSTQSTTQGTVSTVPSAGLLDLRKGDILDLTKYSTVLKKMRASAGWDANERGRDTYDLDLCAYLCSGNKVSHIVYYGDKNYSGISLDGDNLTGEGEGDDENIDVNLDKIPKNINEIYFAVVIYHASSKGQSFSNVHNAYIRLVDVNAGDREICRYRMTENGGDNTAVIAAKLTRGSDGWQFSAIGDYSKNSISTLEGVIERSYLR